MTLQVCILSDTHGVLDPRVARLAAESALVIHGGDVGNAAVLRALRQEVNGTTPTTEADADAAAAAAGGD